ncbi:MAG TPA: prepilin-type N-terminal cleavage/methylation domain-containing protein [Gemmatimonadales bacterium]|nr:prepilin-type N-terminal cleavage/methylation domain-containing protein [Gemmatimonadales bacterium]
MNRRGFTIVELLVVFVVLAILASIAVLKYIDVRNHAIVAGVQSELNSVRLAAYNYWADKNAFPPDAGPGVMPAGMAPYLQSGTFDSPQYTFDWENFQGAGPSGGMQVGIVVTSPDDGLMTLLTRRAAGGLPYFAVGNTVVFMIVGPNGVM